MSDASENDGQLPTDSKGAQPSVIQSFGIYGLYGYRSVSLNSEYAATILIARNGSGKTTLLSVMNAFLRLQFHRLRELDFSEVICKVAGEDPLVLTYDDVLSLYQAISSPEFAKLIRAKDVDPKTMFYFVLEEWQDLPATGFPEHRTFRNIVSLFNYERAEFDAHCEKVRDWIFSLSPKIAHIAMVLKRVLKDTEVVYLPTYRRVELALPEGPEGKRQITFGGTTGGLSSGKIQFGLADISERLSQMNQQMLFDSNNQYRKITASIINELIDGSFDRETPSRQIIPDRDELNLFFTRLQDVRNAGPYYPIARIDIDRIYNREGISVTSDKVLNWFLGKLNDVIKATQKIESSVREFVETCNRYLTTFEPSTDIQLSSTRKPDLESKTLVLDRRTLKVQVENTLTMRQIPLDALSSGEKQMVSLFARLFLYPGEKIFLIDEPELSLSIDWQRQILRDVMNAPLCKQIVAITHSPFVFENDLEPYARPLRVGVDLEKLSSLKGREQ